MEAPSNKPMPSESQSEGSSGMLAPSFAPKTNAKDQVLKDREDLVTKFALLLGTKSDSNAPSASSPSKELSTLIGECVSDQDVVLTVPSLDMRLSADVKSGGVGHSSNTCVLPNVGEHRQANGASRSDSENPANDSSNQESTTTPTMAASVLAGASDTAASLEQKAAQNLGNQTAWTKSTVAYAASAVASNVSESFRSLVDSRVRAWTLLLLRQSLSSGDAESRARLLSMLKASIQMNSVETRFKTLPLPESVASQPKEADVILPLLFEVVVSISIQDRKETVTLRSPGTISANFFGPSDVNGVKSIQVRLDTGVMVSSMVDQARMVVLKAVAFATKTPLPPVSSSLPTSQAPAAVKVLNVNHTQCHDSPHGPQDDAASMPGPPQVVFNGNNPGSLAGFRSALNLTSSVLGSSPQLMKARTSALRLNGVLHGKTSPLEGPTLGQRKNRSVKWDSPVQLPKLTGALAPTPKKQRMVGTACNLTSFKSFGRPHAGDFGSGPRNATFGEYGGRQGVWGRDGRLAHHPMPMPSNSPNNVILGTIPTADRNATFDLAVKARQQMLQRQMTPAGPAPAMQRTATFYENWFVKKAANGGQVS